GRSSSWPWSELGILELVEDVLVVLDDALMQMVVIGSANFATKGVAHGAIALHALVEHASQHGHVAIDVVVDADLGLVAVPAMQAARVLYEGAFPRDGHREKERVEASVVESLTEEPSSCQQKALLAIGDAGELRNNLAPLLHAHASL